METNCCSRRNFLLASAGLPLFLAETNLAFAANATAGLAEKNPNRILVVLELSGGNDGLNTVVPYGDDAYYQARPAIGIRQNQVIKLDNYLGFHTNLPGFERLFKDGKMAVVHGCSYPNPDRSHFVAMRYWHTGSPNVPEERGWVGRFADAYEPQPKNSYIVNIAREQSLAVKSGVHSPVTFYDPNRFVREATPEQKEVFAETFRRTERSSNPSLDFVRGIAQTAAESSDFARHACAEYRSKMDYGYGEVGANMKRIAALIAADSPTRIYYTNFAGFDTHASQPTAHGLQFNQLGDAVLGFYLDMKRIGRDRDVAVLMFTEFGRRVKENASQGTDHGVASPMFLVGSHVKGGFYSKHPSLTDLDEGDLKMTTDFRSVYATAMKEWMGLDDTRSVLKGDYPTLGAFA
jgi:uncharacterized protein (DUF1501 family)